MKDMRVAIVGATGAVGRTMLEILQERDFPLDELSLLASERTAGTRLRFRGEELTVGLLTPEALEGVDLALSSCGSAIAQTWVPQAAERGTTVIDNSSAFRMEPWAELVIPEVNPEALERGAKVYAVPNCTIITALMALAPLHRAAGLESVSLSSYQSVSGAGAKGVRELVEQVEKLHGMEDDLAHPDLDALPVGEVFGKTIAYNVLAKIDVFDPESGSTFEEIKVAARGQADPVAARARHLGDVRSGPGAGGSQREPARDVRAAVLGRARPARLWKRPRASSSATTRPTTSTRAPSRRRASTTSLVGRIRRPEGHDDELLLFACGDNLRKGAALNAVQIAERLP